ncbi:macro domain-containing protein [Qipengyuania sp. GPGPB31]|uniref:macro domain-containing protein n=1 Tax=Qipengyuania sp. GPGPB31 TaxID=3023518 RepID=UPI0031345C57
MSITQDLRTGRFWRHYLTKSFAIFGGIAVVVQTNSIIDPESTIFQGYGVLLALAIISLVSGLFWSWPRPIQEEYDSPKTKISIVRGDLLTQDTHLVIGTVDTFDTETPVIIAKNSLQGQALENLFGGDLKELDDRLSQALNDKDVVDTIHKDGKQNKYGVGTVATVKSAARLIFFLAYCEMDASNKAYSSPDNFWHSLRLLWEEISIRANGDAVSIPVIGGGQARLSNLLPAQDAIRFTILSFIIASRANKICDELRIVVRPEDYKKLDRLELQSFLSSLRAS